MSARTRKAGIHQRAVAEEVASIGNRLFSSSEGAELLHGGRLGFVSARDRRSCIALARDMAAHLARRRRRVALVEMDVRSPQLARLCEVPDATGWTDRLAGTSGSPWSVDPQASDVVLVPAGGAMSDPLAVDDRVLESVLNELRSDVEVTLVILPPLLDAPEALAMLGRLDQVVLAIPAAATRTNELQRARELIASSGVSLAGSVLLDAKYPLPSFLSSLF